MQTIIIDDLPPETVAMLQALYSRSPKSVVEHLKKVKKDPGAFMARYYVGYNHKSIGDCGTTSIFIENVSMIAAKAIQDNPLYCGQEASTRYLDMANQAIVNPMGTAHGDDIQLEWITLYKRVLKVLLGVFEERFPRERDQKYNVWAKAVKARAFDVARGFLPAGCMTYVAWHTNLRQAADHLKVMRYHPCEEVMNIADMVENALKAKYPSSFGHKRYDEQEDYLAKSTHRFAFSESSIANVFLANNRLDFEGLEEHSDLLASRPQKTELHQRFRQYGDIQFSFLLDFGGYRDLQRHRSCVQEMPLLTIKHGIMPWYLEQLPESLLEEVMITIRVQETAINALDISPEEKQYYVAMGYVSPIKITCSLPSAVYIAELRSGTSVHPTVRNVAQHMGRTLSRILPDMALHVDHSEGVWDLKRGTQDIVEKA